MSVSDNTRNNWLSLYNYVPLVFVNCYGNWTPVNGTIVDVRDIAKPSASGVRSRVIFSNRFMGLRENYVYRK